MPASYEAPLLPVNTHTQATGLIVEEHHSARFAYKLTTVGGRVIKVFIDYATPPCYDR